MLQQHWLHGSEVPLAVFLYKCFLLISNHFDFFLIITKNMAFTKEAFHHMISKLNGGSASSRGSVRSLPYGTSSYAEIVKSIFDIM